MIIPDKQSHMARLGDITGLVAATGQNQVIVIMIGYIGSVVYINNYVHQFNI